MDEQQVEEAEVAEEVIDLPPAVLLAMRQKRTTIFTLKPRMCRYPLWEDRVPPIRLAFYCGHETRDGFSYCDAHHKLTTVPRIK